ncbi:MAG: phosphotransferase [Bacteroidales bacterium]|nr:phosphotransferase [Bacteroidales bacterium]
MKEIENLFEKTFKEKITNIEVIKATGSNRYYERLISKNRSCIGAYNKDTKENRAFISFSKQLKANCINVPEIYAEDLSNNVYLQQDLGDTTLFDYLKTHSIEDTMPYYIKVMEQLAKMQTINNFDYADAYPTKEFDRRSMLWDCNYFKYYFLKFFDIQFDEKLLEEDFNTLIDYLQSCRQDFFVYRDFIPRNIMLVNKEPYFIDYQGGRKGSLYYDIASFLFNSKTDLTNSVRKQLFDIYISNIRHYAHIDKEDSRRYFIAYVYFRLIQNLGAYGFRGIYEKKKSFIRSIPFALINLKYLIEEEYLDIRIPCLMSCFSQLLNCQKIFEIVRNNKLAISIKSFSYKRGYPYDVSGNGGGFIFDCRALPNPGREEKFKQKTGLDKEVSEYLQQFKEVDSFFENAMNLVKQTIDNYLKRDFSNLSIYFGCTGGRHRSVYLAQKCGELLSQNVDLDVTIQHLEQNIEKKM